MDRGTKHSHRQAARSPGSPKRANGGAAIEPQTDSGCLRFRAGGSQYAASPCTSARRTSARGGQAGPTPHRPKSKPSSSKERCRPRSRRSAAFSVATRLTANNLEPSIAAPRGRFSGASITRARHALSDPESEGLRLRTASRAGSLVPSQPSALHTACTPASSGSTRSSSTTLPFRAEPGTARMPHGADRELHFVNAELDADAGGRACFTEADAHTVEFDTERRMIGSEGRGSNNQRGRTCP